MKVRIDLLDDNDEVIYRKEGPAQSPLDFKTHPQYPLACGQYNYYGFTYQPIVRVRRTEAEEAALGGS